MSGIPSTSPAEQEPEESKAEVFRGLIRYE